MHEEKTTIGAYGRVKQLFNALIVISLFQIAIYATAHANKLKLVALGDSLTAGYGLPENQAFTAQLQNYLSAQNLNIKVINAGVSGDTSAGGAARLDWALSDGADFVLLELGANDALRGLEPADTHKHLAQIIERLQQKNIPVLLTGMKAPPNLGSEYQAEYDTLFAKLADKYGTAFYPFFLDGVAADPALNQNDGIHPNERGVKLIIEKIGPVIKNWITTTGQS